MARELGEPRGAWGRGCPFLWSLPLLSPSPIRPGALGAFRVVILLGLGLCGGRVVPSPFWPQLQHHGGHECGLDKPSQSISYSPLKPPAGW